MKFVFIIVVAVVGLFAVLVTIGLSPISQNLSQAANDSAVEVLGSNYSQFRGVPELLAAWWIAPVFIMVILVAYGVYKAFKS